MDDKQVKQLVDVGVVDDQKETVTEVKKKDKPATPKSKTIKELVLETESGVHGTGRDRMISLGANYAEVQKEIARRMRTKK